MRNLGFFLMIFIFAGSTVFVAARDIRTRLAPATDADRVAVKEIIDNLQGEKVIPAVKAAMVKEAMPVRSQGSPLVKADIQRIKSFLLGLVQSDTPAEEPK
jgi:hypothetical protein